MIEISKLENIAAELAIVTTVLSFSPNTGISDVCSVVMYLFWALVALFKFFQRNIRINIYAKLMILVYIIWFICTKLFHYLGFYPSDGLGVTSYLFYCVIFYIIGLNSKTDDSGSSRNLTFAFLVAQVILMLTLLPVIDDLSTSYYLNGAKNQMGQMLGVGILLELFIMPELYEKFFVKMIFWICGGVSLIALMMLHSRTPLIAITVVGVYTFVKKNNKSIKDYLSVICIIGVVGIVISQMGGIAYLMELFEITDTSTVSFNSLTSGRGDLYESAIDDFLSSPICGIGGYAYVDNFMLNVLRCGGLISAIMILPLVYGKLFSVVQISNAVLSKHRISDINTNFTYTLVRGMTIFYFVISLMEAYPPLGPGTSMFFLWLLLGIVDNQR